MNPKRPLLDAEFHAFFWTGVPDGQVPPLFSPVTVEGLVGMRAFADANAHMSDEELSLGGRVLVDDRVIPGVDGSPDVEVLVLRPAHATRPLPVIVDAHCGGKCIAGRRNLRGLGFVELVADFEVALVVVQIRPGPEHRHPAQVEDTYAALCWAASQADQQGFDARRIALLGISGGGGIAAGTALYARDRGGPAVEQLILFSPMLDDRDATVSNQFEWTAWSHDSNVAGWTGMLGEKKGGPDVDAYAAVLRADSLAGMPMMYIETGSADIFRDESLELALRAGQDGVAVELHSWAGLVHSGESVNPAMALSQDVLRTRQTWFRRMFAAEPGLVGGRPE